MFHAPIIVFQRKRNLEHGIPPIIYISFAYSQISNSIISNF